MLTGDARDRSTMEEQQLRIRLSEALDALRAIRDGEVDALVDSGRIFSLDSAMADTNRFRGQVLAQINEAVVALDNEHRITYINQAAEEQYAVSASAVLGLPLSALYTYVWLAPGDGEAANQAMADHDHWRGENIHIRHDGVAIQVESTISRLRDQNGEPIGLLAVIRDVTQRARAQAALEESSRQKDHFLATLAHELRNPLSPLMNGLYLLDPELDDPKLWENTRSMMMRQLQHMVRLVDDLMDLSRISRGKLELRLERTDLLKILNNAVEASRPLIDKHHHQLDVHVRPGRYHVNADPSRIMQVISNLLNNSAKYTEPGGHIQLHLDKQDDKAVIRVKDNGIGIDGSDLDRVFDMFAQVNEDARQKNSGGLGIGLNISRRIVIMHQGTISAQSDGEGKGSEFTLVLPLITDDAQDAVNRNEVRHAPVPKREILVVDDNVDGADSLALVLTAAGHSVRVAGNGIEAMEQVKKRPPQIIFMDIGMPLMDGNEACREIRKIDPERKIKIVAISGWGQEQDKQRSMDAGFDMHLVKPVEKTTLDRIISATQQRTDPDR